ncbi:MAG: PBP1A family penicillin-binding protein [Nitrospiraceae bacterium]|nr:PBP1A family penicillin-binding protein [Nitrospiraceae bacterium]
MKKLWFVFLVVLIPLMAGTAIGGYFGVIKDTPSIAELKKGNMAGTDVYADDDSFVTEISTQKSIVVPFREIPKNLVNAVVSVEDSRFYKHNGLDYIALLRAAITDIYYHRIKEGGSTITQQLAKITFLSPERTFKRKLREAALAIKIEKNLTKDEILEIYLNRVYFGHGAYGVQMAAKLYFGKPVSKLTLPEAALLAGLIKGPSEFSPFINARKAKVRQGFVLLRMHQEGYITAAQMKQAVKTQLRLSPISASSESNAYFVDYVKKYLLDKYGPKMVYSGGLKVYTTLRKDDQATAQEAMMQGLRDVDKRRGWRGPLRHINDLRALKSGESVPSVLPARQEITEGTVFEVTAGRALVDVGGRTGVLLKKDAMWAQIALGPDGKARAIKNFDLTKILSPGDVIQVRVKSASAKGLFDLALEQEPEVEGALVAMDPKTGFVRALVGGYDYLRSEYDRALYAKRQAGSAFKPLIYGAAINKGIPPSYVIDDSPVTYQWAGGQWSPKNYEHEFFGPTSLRDALAHSRNVVTVKLLDHIGIGDAIGFAQLMGVTEPMPHDLTLALGSLSITPIDLLCAYAPYDNGGVKVKPILIKYITDSKGRILEANEPSTQRVITPQVAFLMTSMLEDVVRIGTGWRARVLGQDVAGKTGTTSDFRDAWFVGYTPDLMAASWVGLDNMKSLGPGETGARAASPIWVQFMSRVLGKSPSGGFEPPEGISSYTVDSATGNIIDNSPAPVTNPEYYKEYFLTGTEPHPGEHLEPLQPRDGD